MPQTATQTKKVVVMLAGAPDDTDYRVDIEPGASPDGIFEAMGLQRNAENRFPYQLSKPGNQGFFADHENVFGGVKEGDKLTVVPKSPVAF